MKNNNKIYLSPPNINEDEINNVCSALKSGWISPFGSFIDEFSNKLQNYYEKKVLLTNTGTSAIHLALIISKIKDGDYVLCSNFTFAATAFPILYQKAIPIFIGAEKDTWNISPEYLQYAITDLKKKNIHPKALILAHIYGMPAKLKEIINICNDNNILVIEDAAEALGANYNNKPAGSFGYYGILSFNGNKIITCSTGGALILPNKEHYTYAKKIASQAKENIDYYKHNELGYNYAQSNILAAIGCAQFEKLESKVNKRREIFNSYLSILKENTDIKYQIEDKYSVSNRWLSSFIFNNSLNKKIKKILDNNNIESRYLWNPLHKQIIFKNNLFYGDGNWENELFNNGLSLPSGDNLNENDLDKIFTILKTIINQFQ